ncbi:MAG: alpha/beta hydrolase [Epulopiscium sp.]|nr:alpha/beta hydrolase [Candidatus Epulonipiscium sp.]
MVKKEFTFPNSDKNVIHVYQWIPTQEAKGIVQIAHGMAERASRYDYFASVLVKEGFIVYAHDHRGHGRSATSIEDLGYISDNDGFSDMVMDMKSVTDIAKMENPNLPIILFGHSMGSFLAQRYIQLYGNEIAGVILSGTNGKQKSLVNVGILLSKIIIAFKGRRASGKRLDKLTFGHYNHRFKPNKTKFDWLSRDEEEVRRYVEDPYCGTLFPASFFHDLYKGTKMIHQKDNLAQIPKGLPIYIFAGDEDPVGEYGKGVISLYKTYESLGIRNVSYKLYSGGRHEMLNEINKDEVIRDVIAWITKII